MGGCFSNVKGGEQAIGTGIDMVTDNGNSRESNDAIDHFYKSQGLQPLFSQFEFTLSATKLLDRNILSKSNPMAVVYMKKQDGNVEEIGRTEVILNSLNPSWIHKIPVAYNFEIVQPLVFHVYDVDEKFHSKAAKDINLSEQKFLGEASCFMSEVVTKQYQRLTVSLQNNHLKGDQKTLGTLAVHTEESALSRTTVEIIFRCTNLKNRDFFPKSDPFLRISRNAESEGTIPICKTEVIHNNSNPTWQPVCLTMHQVVSKDNPLIIECFHFKSKGHHQLIGKLQRTISELENLHQETVCVNFVERRHGQDKILKGGLFVDRFREDKTFSFVDYISSGFELDFMVAVDFTSSNGNPKYRYSLHRIDSSGKLNAYQRAIVEAGEVLQFYDSDKRFPAWGFGAKVPNVDVSYCFNLNLASNDPEVDGVQGIMSAYESLLKEVKLSGPTLLDRVINKALEIAEQSVSSNRHKYHILLLITDGVCNDFQLTIDALVKASHLPLSVLIVGVGDADFKDMKILDEAGGRHLQSSTGELATRDIVQFMPMREVDGGRMSLTQALLGKLPGQFLAYMRSKNINPLKEKL